MERSSQVAESPIGFHVLSFVIFKICETVSLDSDSVNNSAATVSIAETGLSPRAIGCLHETKEHATMVYYVF